MVFTSSSVSRESIVAWLSCGAKEMILNKYSMGATKYLEVKDGEERF